MRSIATALVVAFAFVGRASAQSTAPPNDYGKPESWLCRPGLTAAQDACAIDLTTTVVTEDGRYAREPFSANSNPPIDCFYVYPTVSLDPTANSDMSIGPEERNVIRAQFARFAAACRLYAPMYRQVTLTALRAGMAGKPMAVDRTLAYTDVVTAWNHYLKNDNQGRGVVLIGHSQGSGVLSELIRREIDGKPIQSQIVSAILAGTNVAVPNGKDVGGAFKTLPICRAANQTGCAIAYVSFRSNVPPPADSRFGKVQAEGMEAACANPAALGGGKGQLKAHLTATGREWVTPPEAVNTPFVSVPRLLTSQCVSNDSGSYLEVTVNGDPHDPRTDDIGGDVVTNGKVVPSWGLHLIDVQVAIGNLVEIVGQQAKAYGAKKSR
jgi:hypothetical protein